MKNVFVALSILCAVSFGAYLYGDNTTLQSSDIEIDFKDDEEATTGSQFRLPDGFSIDLIVDEPDVINPMRMAIDEHGVIYVSEAHNYRAGGGRVPDGEDERALEDVTNPIKRLEIGADGQLERATIVAEGFDNPVMGIYVHEEKLYATSLNELFVMDIGPDGQLSNRQLLVEDAAAPWNPFGMYRVIVGPDHKLWLSIADHPASDPVTLTGSDGHTVRLNGQSGGLVRSNLDGSGLEIIADGLRAPYTFNIDPWGHVWIISNGEGSPDIFLDAIPGMDYGYASRKVSYEWLAGRAPLAPPVHDMGSGANTTAFEYYSSMFPTDYWGDFFIANWGSHGYNPANRVVRRFIRHESANATALGLIEDEAPFLAPLTDTMFRPTGIVYAPDGGLYLSDWHGRDDENNNYGRIYKVTYDAEDTHEAEVSYERIAEMEPGELTDLLNHSNHLVRQQSQRALAKKGDHALDALGDILKKGDPFSAANAVWVLTRMNSEPAAQTMQFALDHTDPRVRAHGLRQLRQAAGQNFGRTDENINDLDNQKLIDSGKLDELARPLLGDPDAEVRIEAALALKSPEEINSGLVTALKVAESPRLRYQIGFELGQHSDRETLESLYNSTDRELQQIAFIAAETALYKNTPQASIVSDWELPTEIEPEQLVERIQAGEDVYFTDMENRTLLDWLKVNPPSDESLYRTLLRLLANSDTQVDALQAVRLAGEIDPDYVATVRDNILEILNNTSDESLIMEALYTLGSLKDNGSPEEWLPWLEHPSTNIATAALRALSLQERESEFVNALWEAALNTASRDSYLSIEVRSSFQELGISEEQLAQLSALQEKPEDKQQLEQKVLSHLDDASAMRGRLIFNTRKSQCASCHAVRPGNAMSLLGPNINDIGAVSQPQYLIQSIVRPNETIKTGNRLETITTKDGRTITGQVETDSQQQQLIVRMPGVDPVEIPQSDVESRTSIPVSLMPSGLDEGMTVSELADLTEYLRSLKGME